MVFSSPVFIFAFLPLTLFLCLALPRRAQNTALLVLSLLFYAAGGAAHTAIVLVSIGWNYAFGRIVGATQGSARKWGLVLAVTGNLGLLIAFKYAGWLTSMWNGVAASTGLPQVGELHVELPIGISFFTFQALSYVVDVSRGHCTAQRRLDDLALYIVLFPQLIAGPIVRYADVAREIEARSVSLIRIGDGVRRFIHGLAKKVLLANTVGVVADRVFDADLACITPLAAWVGVLCYTLQIYFDFSGYSDMAIGLGRMFGFRFKENFLYPYAADSVQEFWRRWHISLSTFFRDYLYIPLGGSHAGPWKTHRNLFVVFTLCGLWHGASFSFLVWGLYHGTFLALERVFHKALTSTPRAVRHMYVVLVVMVGWVPFRAETLSHAVALLKRMAFLDAPRGALLPVAWLLQPDVVVAIVLGGLLSVRAWPAMETWILRRTATPAARRALILPEMALLAALFVLSTAWLAGGTHNPFIYFRF